MHLDFILFKLTQKLFGNILVFVWKDLFQRFHNGYLCAHAAQELADFTADNAAANDNNGFRSSFQIQHFVRGDDLFSVIFEHSWAYRNRTGGQDNFVCFNSFG